MLGGSGQPWPNDIPTGPSGRINGLSSIPISRSLALKLHAGGLEILWGLEPWRTRAPGLQIT